jgi:hypothetical protein
VREVEGTERKRYKIKFRESCPSSMVEIDVDRQNARIVFTARDGRTAEVALSHAHRRIEAPEDTDYLPPSERGHLRK